ncbi:putative transposase [Candidatus Erwinia dacicola]|uniref:Transposase n=1 Tax=Candidatus Erwinia dacicola TaxID=252393 RepID=A0A328TSG7_9GAMM|nr:putative transposase [Candidatus Erwinia dacicola]
METIWRSAIIRLMNTSGTVICRHSTAGLEGTLREEDLGGVAQREVPGPVPEAPVRVGFSPAALL